MGSQYQPQTWRSPHISLSPCPGNRYKLCREQDSYFQLVTEHLWLPGNLLAPNTTLPWPVHEQRDQMDAGTQLRHTLPAGPRHHKQRKGLVAAVPLLIVPPTPAGPPRGCHTHMEEWEGKASIKKTMRSRVSLLYSLDYKEQLP